MSGLANKSCVPCRGGVPPLGRDEVERYLAEVEDWRSVEDHHITKTYRFKDFAGALAFVNAVGALAEQENHHPDVHLSWGEVRLDVWTHKIDGLTESDFILAAKSDALYGHASR